MFCDDVITMDATLVPFSVHNDRWRMTILSIRNHVRWLYRVLFDVWLEPSSWLEKSARNRLRLKKAMMIDGTKRQHRWPVGWWSVKEYKCPIRWKVLGKRGQVLVCTLGWNGSVVVHLGVPVGEALKWFPHWELHLWHQRWYSGDTVVEENRQPRERHLWLSWYECCCTLVLLVQSQL